MRGFQEVTPRRSASRNRRLGSAGVLLAVVAAVLMTSVPVASSATLRLNIRNITGTGASTLGNPRTAAVDNYAGGASHGDVYVVDPTNYRIVKFDPSGNFLLMFGKDVNSGTGNPDVCTDAGSPTDVCQAGSFSSEAGGFRAPRFIVTDPTNGDVYVADNTSPVIQKFNPDGTLKTSWPVAHASPAAGQLDGQGVVNGPFGAFAGITVDNSGNLLVLNSSSSRVWKFAQDGTAPSTTFTLARGTNQFGLDVDSSGNIFKMGGNALVKFDSSGSVIGQVDQGGTGQGFVYDRTNDDVYVVHFNNHITRQHFVGSDQIAVDPLTTCTFSGFSGCANTEIFGAFPDVSNPTGVGVNYSNGFIFVANPNKHNVMEWGNVTVPDVATAAPTNLDQTALTINGTVDPAGGGEVVDCHFSYGTDTNYESGDVPCLDSSNTVVGTVGTPITSATEVHADLSLLTPDVTYHYQLVAANAIVPNPSPDATVTPHAVRALNTEPASQLEPSTATLNASYIATDDDTTYHFEWGTTTSYAHSTTPVGPEHQVSGTQQISTDVVGLVPSNTYHYRVVATNSVGTSYGDDVTFTAPEIPAIVGQSVSNLTATSVDLNAAINPHDSETTYRFDYGPSVSYGQSAPIPDGTLSAGNASEPVTVHLSDLTPHTVYHFQVVATNEFGTAVSGDLSFNFYPPGCPNESLRQQSNADSLPDCRAYELVSPEEAGSAIIFSGPTPQSPTATSPSRTTFASAIGAVVGVGEPANVRGDLYMSTRTSTGWKTRYVGLPATMTQWSGGPPWNIAYNNTYYAQNFGDVMTDPSMSLIGIWDRGYYYCNVNDYATCQTDGSAEWDRWRSGRSKRAFRGALHS